MWDLAGNPEDRFSHNEAHIKDCCKFSLLTFHVLSLLVQAVQENLTQDCYYILPDFCHFKNFYFNTKCPRIMQNPVAMFAAYTFCQIFVHVSIVHLFCMLVPFIVPSSLKLI